MSFLVISGQEVAEHLSYEACIPLMRRAMIALSSGRTRQLLRSIIDLEGGSLFGIMPGSMDAGPFGAKLISIFPDCAPGAPSHQGVLVLFDPATGAPACLIEAGELTAIRTAAASAAATDALARPDASRLAIIGTGEQAWRHIEAISHVRLLSEVMIWGRSAEKSEALSTRTRDKLGISAKSVAGVEAAVADADMTCTVTAAAEPILFGRWIRPGTHLNVVGSGRAGPSEIDSGLVACSRFFADHRESVLRQGAEFLDAKAEGLIGDDHIAGEIGEVFAGTVEGRRSTDEITLYKSLGNIVQDLAAGWHLHQAALERGFGSHPPL
jgi:ornithine cyclodeaminase/alanine dehydrogenase-like protein (mu-crystallin family)